MHDENYKKIHYKLDHLKHVDVVFLYSIFTKEKERKNYFFSNNQMDHMTILLLFTAVVTIYLFFRFSFSRISIFPRIYINNDRKWISCDCYFIFFDCKFSSFFLRGNKYLFKTQRKIAHLRISIRNIYSELGAECMLIRHRFSPFSVAFVPLI